MTDAVDLVHHTVSVPATTANLGPGFDAFGLALRDPGASDGHVASLVVASRPRTGGPRVEPRGVGVDEVTNGDDNLVWRSLVAFCEHVDAAVPAVDLVVVNAIPLERGLGSSSAAIVAGLTMGRALTGAPVGDLDLIALATALEGHPDNVAPALLGGLVACTTDDDGGLVVRRVNPAPTLRPVLLVPHIRQATSVSRAVLPDHLPRAAVAAQAARAGHVLAALAGVWPAAVGASGDLLHEPARFAAMPASGALVTALRHAGVHAWLSGAGPSVAAVLGVRDPAGADALRRAAQEHDVEVHHLEVDLAGALACPDGGCAWSALSDCVRCPRRRV